MHLTNAHARLLPVAVMVILLSLLAVILPQPMNASALEQATGSCDRPRHARAEGFWRSVEPVVIHEHSYPRVHEELHYGMARLIFLCELNEWALLTYFDPSMGGHLACWRGECRTIEGNWEKIQRVTTSNPEQYVFEYTKIDRARNGGIAAIHKLLAWTSHREPTRLGIFRTYYQYPLEAGRYEHYPARQEEFFARATRSHSAVTYERMLYTLPYSIELLHPYELVPDGLRNPAEFLFP